MKALILLATLLAGTAALAENRVDRIRPDAPELAPYGAYAVGVRTVEIVHRDQIDVVHAEPGEPPPRYDRPLTLEVWYPAAAGCEPTPYEVYLRDGETRVTVQGRACRGAAPQRGGAPYALVLISHGYPGNRYLLAPLAENLASKGYVVASIDHTDSTYRTRAAFASTLVNRPLDQLFVLAEMARLGAEDGSFLAGLVDADHTGLVGYSMGGYGAVITAGGGITAAGVERGAPDGLLAIHRAGSSAHESHFDARIKGVVAFAPWGMESGTWDAEGLAGVKIPTLFIAGSADDVSGYRDGVRALFEQTVSVDRWLLTFANANHNAAAPMPAPDETLSWSGDGPNPFGHYADAVWDTVRMNNIAAHFVTAWFGLLLRDDPAMAAYLDLVEDSNDGVWALDAGLEPKPEHTYWKGFANRTAKGLRLERLAAGE